MNIPEVATQYFNEGNQLLEEGKLEEAIAIFRRAIEVSPDISWCHQNLGEALAKLGQLEEAIAAFRRAIKLNPDFSWSYHHLGDALDRQQQWEEAVVAFRRAIELNPEHFGSYCGLGQGLVNLGQLDEAIAAYRRASELEPAVDWIQYRLGEVLQQRTQLDLEGAIASYRRSIDLNPHDVQAYRKLLTIQPDNFEIYLELGNTLVKQNQWEEAIAAYRHACQLNPDSFDSYWQLGKIFYQQRLLKLKDLQSHPDVKATLLEECQSQSWQVPSNQLNDAGFVKATSILNDEDLIRELYRAYLKREPEPNAISFYSEILRSGGLTRLTLLSSFRDSAEFKLLSIRYKDREYQIFAHWQAIEISYENLAEEIACYRRAIELSSNYYECYWNLGKALARHGDATEAIASYQKAVQIGMQLAQENKLEEAFSCYQKALEVIPDQIAIYSDLGMILVRLGCFEDLLTCYRQTFSHAPNRSGVYQSFGILLAQQGLIDEAVACFQQFSQIQRPSEGNIYENIWKGLNQLNLQGDENRDCEVQIQPQKAEDYFRLASRYKVITLQSLTEDDKKYLENVGLSLPNLELIAQNNFALEKIYIKSFSDSPKHLHEPLRLTLPYQQVLVETGYVHAVCPFSGKIIRSNQSFVINHQEVGHHDLQGFLYRFVGKEIFYLMTGCPMGEKLLIYIPKLELIINFNEVLVGFARPLQSINKFKSYMVSYREQVKSYLSTQEPKQLANVIGLGFNLGHYVWQDLEGIHVLLKNGILDKLDKVLTGPGEYFSCKDIFPEISADKFIGVKDVCDVFQKVIENNYVALRINGIFIQEELVKKINHAATMNKCSQDILATVERAKQYFPLLCIHIRVIKRRWLGMTEGIANIINKLHSDYPNLGVVFSGWSVTGKEDIDNYCWSIIEQEKAKMEEIKALILPTISTFSCIGSTIEETVVWTNAIDAHISPIGAELTFLSWIANKPGVVHGPTVVYWAERIYDSSTYRENLLPQVFLPKNYIVDKEGGLYDCDWQAIYDEIFKIINQLNPS
jgi:tetratricopeptide (TPR) repeat protein